jgi:hypothetical protein
MAARTLGCWMYGEVCHRDGKPLKMIGHSHTDRLRRIGEASFLEEGTTAIAPFVLKTMAGVHVPVAADFDFEGDFFYFCDNILDERSDLYY